MNTKRGKFIYIILVAVLLGLILPILFTSCFLQKPLPAPYYHVDTLDELKADLAGYPNLLLPDLSGYQMNADYNVQVWNRWNKKARSGYSIYGDDVLVADIVFSRFHLSCLELKHWVDDLNLRPPVWPNNQYFGVDVAEYFEDFTNDQETLDLYGIPKNTSAFNIHYDFDFNACRYTMGADLYLPNGGDKEKVFSAETERGKEELLKLMKSIIDQGTEERLLTGDELLAFIENNPKNEKVNVTTSDFEGIDLDDYIKFWHITEYTIGIRPFKRSIWEYSDYKEKQEQSATLAAGQ